jgi:phosphoribosylformylglycinamidine synthase PurS subunit
VPAYPPGGGHRGKAGAFAQALPVRDPQRGLFTFVYLRAFPKESLTTDAHIQSMTAYTATVTVRLKHGVLDPEAETTQQALERLGFDLEDLRSADRFEIDVEAADADAAADRAGEMADRLLANPTIHDYDVAVTERE